jgi:hypothetical protein
VAIRKVKNRLAPVSFERSFRTRIDLVIGVFFERDLSRELFARTDVSTVEAVNHQDVVIVFDRPAVLGTDERYLFSVLKVE